MTMDERLALAKLEARIAGTRPAEIVVGGRFAVTALLGRRGAGELVRAHDRAHDRDVALTSVPAGVVDARALVQVQHDNVVPVLEVIEDPSGVFVVAPWIDGLDLRAWLAAQARPWRDVVDTMIAAGRGLAAVHAVGLVHGELTPDRVLVGSDGIARIVDFGRPAAPRDEASGYLAPEQYAGEPADALVDQLAFCLVLFEALYSTRAIDAKLAERLRVDPFAWSLPDAHAGVPQRIHAVIARGAARERSARYPSMTALIDDLAHAGDRTSSRSIAAAGVALAIAVTIAAIRCGA